MEQFEGTKKAIFEAAAGLFSKEGYHNVSMREIAQEVGIRSSSIYNHFSSKQEILEAIYAYFDGMMDEIKPDLDELLALVETQPPHEVMLGTVFTYPEESLSTMAKAMLVTASMSHVDEYADQLVYKNLIRMSFDYDVPLLEKMMKLGRIEPINPQHFALLHSSFCHSTAVRFYTNHTVDSEAWVEGLQMLFQLVKPKL